MLIYFFDLKLIFIGLDRFLVGFDRVLCDIVGHVVDVVGFRVGREVMLGLKSRFVHVSGDFITLFSIFVVFELICNGLML